MINGQIPKISQNVSVLCVSHLFMDQVQSLLKAYYGWLLHVDQVVFSCYHMCSLCENMQS